MGCPVTGPWPHDQIRPQWRPMQPKSGTARSCGPMELLSVQGGLRCRRQRQPCDDDPDDSRGGRQSHGEDQSASGLILRRLPATDAEVGHDGHTHPVSGPKTVGQRHTGEGAADAGQSGQSPRTFAPRAAATRMVSRIPPAPAGRDAGRASGPRQEMQPLECIVQHAELPV